MDESARLHGLYAWVEFEGESMGLDTAARLYVEELWKTCGLLALPLGPRGVSLPPVASWSRCALLWKKGLDRTGGCR